MNIRLLSAFISMLALAACASISPDLTKAATQATDAAATAQAVNKEIVTARILHLVSRVQFSEEEKKEKVPAILVCNSLSISVDETAKALGAYADAINLVGKVAAKPDASTYAGYFAQFKKNQAVIDDGVPDLKKAAEKDNADAAEAQKRCSALLKPDLEIAQLNGPLPKEERLKVEGPPAGGVAPIIATIVSVDALIKSVLAAGEQAQRAEAVRAATKSMLVVLDDATTKLKEPTDSSSDYTLPGGPATRLGNTLAIHRWIAAQRLYADWLALKSCAKDFARNLLHWQMTDNFVADSEKYRALAANDADKLLAQLTDALASARANFNKASLADMLDSLSAIGASLSDISDKYTAYRKTLN